AFQFFGGFHGLDGRTWLLAIVRNTCYTWLQRQQAHAPTTSLSEETLAAGDAVEPIAGLLRAENQMLVHEALEELPVDYREVMVLRELEGLSYKEIAQVASIPIGTVMSRLARARERLQQILSPRLRKDP